jgi:hypothetical protein
MKLGYYLTTLLALFPLAACGGGGSSSSSGGDGGADAGPPSCATLTNVSDGPTEDAVADGATTLVCYYPQPTEGYCRKLSDPTQVALFFSSMRDKKAIGCGDAVILGDAECPTKNAVGRCDTTSIEAERVYYQCSKFDKPEDNCSAVMGTYTAL